MNERNVHWNRYHCTAIQLKSLVINALTHSPAFILTLTLDTPVVVVFTESCSAMCLPREGVLKLLSLYRLG